MNNIYVIALNNGDAYEIEAEEVEWDINAKYTRFIAAGMIVAMFNNDSIAGWMNKSYMIIEKEGKD